MEWPCNTIGSADSVVENLLAQVDCNFLSVIENPKGKIIDFINMKIFNILLRVLWLINSDG